MRIPAWNDFHETHESRKLKALRYLNVPNKHDGWGYAEIMDHPKGVEIFGAWILILQVASKCPSRGILRKSDGKPVDSAGLAAKTRAPREVFDLAIPFLCKIGWLALEPGDSAGTPGDSPGITPIDSIGLKGIELKRIELKRIEGEGETAASPPPSQAPLTPAGLKAMIESGTPADRETRKWLIAAGDAVEYEFAPSAAPETGLAVHPAEPTEVALMPPKPRRVAAEVPGNMVAGPPELINAMEWGESRSPPIPHQETEMWYLHFTANGWRMRSGLVKNWHASLLQWRNRSRDFAAERAAATAQRSQR